MKNTYILILVLSSFLSGKMHSQITNPAPYCAARIDASTLYYKDVIRAVDIGTLSNVTGTVYYSGSDYVYYNNISPVSLQKGTTIPATFTIVRNDIEMDLIWVYIDYNNNSSFDASELVGQAAMAQFTPASSYGSSVTINFNISIPMSAQNGQTRMRVIYSSDGNMWSVTTPTACNSYTSSLQGPSFQYGEIEDYNVMITGSTVLAPSASFSVASNACKGKSITLTDNSTNVPTVWSWTLSGATPSTSSVQNPTVTYSVAGNYTIMLSSSNAGGASSVVSKTLAISACTGIQQMVTVAEKLSVYPNPGNGYFNLESKEPFQIVVYNVCGMKILEQNFDGGKQLLDLFGQPAGIYFITAFSKNQTQNLKLIKE